MAGSKDNRKDKQENGRADRISAAVRLALLVFEVASTLLREHLLRWYGP